MAVHLARPPRDMVTLDTDAATVALDSVLLPDLVASSPWLGGLRVPTPALSSGRARAHMYELAEGSLQRGAACAAHSLQPPL